MGRKERNKERMGQGRGRGGKREGRGRERKRGRERERERRGKGLVCPPQGKILRTPLHARIQHSVAFPLAPSKWWVFLFFL